MSGRRPSPRYRWSVASRVLAASAGGYAFVSLLSATAALVLPMSRIDAYFTSGMSAFVIYAVVIMAVFHARSASRAWAWLVIGSIPLAIISFLLWPGGGT